MHPSYNHPLPNSTSPSCQSPSTKPSLQHSYTWSTPNTKIGIPLQPVYPHSNPVPMGSLALPPTHSNPSLMPQDFLIPQFQVPKTHLTTPVSMPMSMNHPVVPIPEKLFITTEYPATTSYPSADISSNTPSHQKDSRHTLPRSRKSSPSSNPPYYSPGEIVRIQLFHQRETLMQDKRRRQLSRKDSSSSTTSTLVDLNLLAHASLERSNQLTRHDSIKTLDETIDSPTSKLLSTTIPGTTNYIK